MFGREARIPLNTMFQSQIRNLGNDENILSIQALKNMYQLVAENLQKARKRMAPTSFPQPNKLKTEDSVMIKDHTAGPFDIKEITELLPLREIRLKLHLQKVAKIRWYTSQMLNIYYQLII